MLLALTILTNVLISFSPNFNEVEPVPNNTSDPQHKTKLQIIVFLSPHCPICQNYSSRLNEINNLAIRNDIELLGVVSGDYFSSAEINEFVSHYKISFNVVLDADYTYRNKWSATTTPEVIFSKDDSLLYRGMIDNWYYKIGRSTNKTTKFYLLDALKATLSGETIKISETTPVGCLIE